MQRDDAGPWRQELSGFNRAFSGAFLFGVPLLFTMEMWWIGTFAHLWKLLVFLGLTFLAGLGLTYLAGFKKEHGFAAVVIQAINVVAIGVIAATVILFVLDRIAPGDPLDSILGKIIIQAVPLSIGAALANAVFRRGENREHGDDDGRQPESAWRLIFNDIGATAIGGVFIGFSIAPTDEVQLLASELDYVHELILIALSLAVTYGIVFTSGFDAEQRATQKPALFQRPVTETSLAYMVSLVVAFVALFLFDRVRVGDPASYVLAQVLVLGFPTAVGGAAGRLAV